VRSGVDFARAVASLGVDRGIDRFNRHVLVARFGRSPLAVPVGRVRVDERSAVTLTRALDVWVSRLRGASNLPAGIESTTRRLDAAMYGLATQGPAESLAEVIASVGALHSAVERSSTVRASDKELRPLEIADPEEWLDALPARRTEVSVAAALASLHDDQPSPAGSLRGLLTGAAWSKSKQRLEWLDRPLAPLSGSGVGLHAALAEAHRRRAQPGAAPQPDADGDVATSGVGTVSAFQQGREVTIADLVAFADQQLDDLAVAESLAGLLLFNWTRKRTRAPASTPGVVTPPMLALLAPFFTHRPYDLMVRGQSGAPPTRRRVLLRPGSDWIPRLRADGIESVAQDAVRRLRIAGIKPGVRASSLARCGIPGDRLAAALLLKVSHADRIRLLRSIAIGLEPTRAFANADITNESGDQP
jgi:CRISPR-associated protein Csx17